MQMYMHIINPEMADYILEILQTNYFDMLQEVDKL